MRTQTEDGFVWLDTMVRSAPCRSVPHARTRDESPAAGPVSAEAVGASHASDPAPMPSAPRANAYESALLRWREARGSIWPRRIVSVARSAMQGRRAFLGACLDLTDAIAVELRHALLTSS